MAVRKKRSGLLRRTLFALLVFVLVLGAGDFFLFASRISADPGLSDVPEADAVIVLTGGAGRIEAGVSLVAQGASQRVLISGVYPETTLEQLKAEQGGPEEVYDCCTDLGVWATSTTTNAEEAAVWSDANDIHRMILVTSDYHMPRALIEFRHVMPDHEIIPFPVSSSRDGADREPGLRRLAREWLKYRMAWLLRGGAGN